jgi:hypothetical protein
MRVSIRLSPKQILPNRLPPLFLLAAVTLFVVQSVYLHMEKGVTIWLCALNSKSPVAFAKKSQAGKDLPKSAEA